MPLIALTGGCDPVHTLMKKIGIDPVEFTNGAGNGMVHVYRGADAYGLPPADGSVSDATDAYAFWGNKSEVFKYDMMINECECAPHARDTKGPAYDNIAAFLDAAAFSPFNTHQYSGNPPCQPDSDYPQVVVAALQREPPKTRRRDARRFLLHLGNTLSHRHHIPKAAADG
jgi:hypothetical protein